MSEEVIQKVKDILRPDLDWDRFIEDSCKHGVAPLIYLNFRKIDSELDVIPNQVLLRLKSAYYSNLRYNTLLFRELKKILDAFKSEGIQVIVLKGAALAELIYKNIALRPMSDIDILVKRKDLPTVDRILSQLQYSSSSYTPPSSQWHVKGWVEHIPPYVKIDDITIRVEIHLDIATHYEANIRAIDSSRAWENALPATIAGIDNVLVLPLEELLIRLCLHASKHIYSGREGILMWWCDIAEVEKSYRGKIDWEYITRISKEYRIQAPVYHSLNFAREWLDAVIPENVLRELKPPLLIISVEDFSRAIIEGRQYLQAWVKSQASFLGTVDGISNKLRCTFRILFPTKEFMMHRYFLKRPILVYLYYPVRFFTGLRALCQLISGYTKALYQLFNRRFKRTLLR